MSNDSPRCHACTAEAVARFRIRPYSATRTLFDAQPRDVRACAAHLESAKKIGTVLSMRSLAADPRVAHATDPRSGGPL